MQVPAVGRRRLAGDAPKHAIELRQRLKPGLEGGLADPHVGFEQELFGPFDARPGKIVGEPDSRARPEDLAEIERTHVHRPGDLGERERLGQVLGANSQYLDPQVGSVGCEPGDRFLFCTDGVIDGIWDHALADMLAKDDAKTIVEHAVAESGKDNASAVVVVVE